MVDRSPADILRNQNMSRAHSQEIKIKEIKHLTDLNQYHEC